jgi:hypothetical protein
VASQASTLATGTALDVRDFAERFQISVERLPDPCRTIIETEDFSYRVPVDADRDAIILDVLKRLASDSQRIGAEERRAVWERGWREALNDYVDSSYSPSSLVPKFIRPNQPVRLDQRYVIPTDARFELNFVRVLREWMFREFFAEADEIHEFGCGTGFNLVALAEIYPQKRLFGSDFVPASVELVNEIATKMALRLSARLFDMITPPRDYPLGGDSAIFTFGSLEQLASRFEAFLAFLLERKPRLCVHVEPTVEVYDADNLVDYLAIRFHRQRGYTEGFLPRLQALHAAGQIELLRTTRLHFGSLMMEGYNLMVWRPAR